ncbi:hypothetical protein BMA721280_D0024 [Burkholderia mallei 2002721280]|nr:hypothetical protein BMA721280_D0024 [Burkholderia mallei 2002721280]EDO94961.1 hypothetical protein BURPSPAST_AB0126 [Burkholderia pseudomallei Pasteur 52237]EDS84339.1 hypothetical protein BURPSS13_A0127 [Burkholderia pseudomallei S13]
MILGNTALNRIAKKSQTRGAAEVPMQRVEAEMPDKQLVTTRLVGHHFIEFVIQRSVAYFVVAI